MAEQHPKTPAEFTRDMPEDDPAGGSGAGPGAPETDEPRTGRPGNAGHGPGGESESAPSSWTDPPDPRVERRDAASDSRMGPGGMLAVAAFAARRLFLKGVPGGR